MKYLHKCNEPLGANEIYSEIAYELKKSLLKKKHETYDMHNTIKESVSSILALKPIDYSGRKRLGQYIDYIQINPGKGYRYLLAKHVGLDSIKNKRCEYLSACVNKIAIISELIHILSLVVDDYIDDDVMRHGDLALYKKYNPVAIIHITELISETIYRLIEEMDLQTHKVSELHQLVGSASKTLAAYFKIEAMWQYKPPAYIKFGSIKLKRVEENYVCKAGGISLFSLKALAIINPENKSQILNYSPAVKQLAILLQRANDLENLAPLTFQGTPNFDRFTDLSAKRCTYLTVLNAHKDKKMRELLELIYNQNKLHLQLDYFDELLQREVLSNEISQIENIGISLSINTSMKEGVKAVIKESVEGYIKQMKTTFNQ